MSKYDLFFEPPLMNAAGTLGFAPDTHGPVDLDRLGAFVTNPISLQPRSAAAGRRYLPHAGGFLLHTGHPNAGLKTVLHQNAARWARSPIPVIVHLLCQEADEVRRMMAYLEGVEGVMGVELGLPPQADPALILALAQAAQGELPVIACLPLERALDLAPALTEADAVTAISLATPRGALPLPEGGSLSGRLYGPAVFPLALSVTQALHHSALPLIAAGGVYQKTHMEALFEAGAMAVQIDTVLWRGGWEQVISPSKS